MSKELLQSDTSATVSYPSLKQDCLLFHKKKYNIKFFQECYEATINMLEQICLLLSGQVGISHASFSSIAAVCESDTNSHV